MNYRKTEDGLVLRDWTFLGTIAVLELYDKSKIVDAPICYALVTSSKNENSVILWHIQTHRNYLRKGYATNLLTKMKDHFDEIITQINMPEGNALCKKCGLKQIKDQLIWKKEKKDGSSNNPSPSSGTEHSKSKNDERGSSGDEGG